MDEKQKRICLESSGYLHTIIGSCKTINNEEYVIFSINMRKTSFNLGKSGIFSISREEAFDEFFNGFYGTIQSAFLNDMTVKKYAGSSQPLMVIGEIGTGKGQMVRLIYAKSRLASNPLITIDFSRLTERAWSYLLESDSSPLCGSNATIYLKGIKGTD